MKFIIDQQLPPVLVRWLTARGHDAEHVREIGMREADDNWRCAIAVGAIVITKDEDFAQRRSQADGPQIVWLRVGNTTRQALLDRLDDGWLEIEAALAGGASVVEVR